MADIPLSKQPTPSASSSPPRDMQQQQTSPAPPTSAKCSRRRRSRTRAPSGDPLETELRDLRVFFPPRFIRTKQATNASSLFLYFGSAPAPRKCVGVAGATIGPVAHTERQKLLFTHSAASWHKYETLCIPWVMCCTDHMCTTHT